MARFLNFACILGSVYSIGFPGQAAHDPDTKLGSGCPMAKLRAEVADLPDRGPPHRQLNGDDSGLQRELQTTALQTTACISQKKMINPVAIYGDVAKVS